jgi:hypothetical protein
MPKKTKKKADTTERVALNFKVSPKVRDLLDRLALQCDLSNVSVLRKSLTLLDRCLAAKKVTLTDSKGKSSTIEFLE